jgi:hypothetical protein
MLPCIGHRKLAQSHMPLSVPSTLHLTLCVHPVVAVRSSSSSTPAMRHAYGHACSCISYILPGLFAAVNEGRCDCRPSYTAGAAPVVSCSCTCLQLDFLLHGVLLLRQLHGQKCRAMVLMLLQSHINPEQYQGKL